MNFFEQQEAARSASRRLIVLFVIAVACTVLAVDGVIALTWGLFASGQLGDLFTTIAELPAKFYWTTSAVTTLVILTMTWRRMNQLEDGGTAVASGIGAVPIRSNTTDPLERRLRNVVEEMAIASGVRVPALYVLDEKGINAFSAGFDSSQAVVVVTRGALESLNRDELQGVVGHEFSHILNGDVAVNIRMMGVLAGIVTIGSVGLFILRGRVRSRGKGGLYLVILGALLVAVGTIGLFFARLIKMSISREREFLADAASVQFTRNPEGIAGALDEINDGSLRSFIHAETAEEVSHMFFCSCAGPTVGGWFATHPPIGERIQRVDPQFKSTAYRKKRAPAAEGAPATVTSAVSGGGTAAATHPAPKVPLAAFVGTAGAAQLQSTREALEGPHEPLRVRLRQPDQARATILALLLSRNDEVMAKQLAAVEAVGATELARLAREEAPAAREIKPTHLIVIDLALPAIKSTSPESQAELLKAAEAAIRSDATTTIHEFAVLTLLRSQLAPRKGGPAAKYNSIAEVRTDALALLGLFASAGIASPDDADRIFEAAIGAGVDQFQISGNTDVVENSAVDLDAATAMLDRLRDLAPRAKERLINGLFAAITADGTIRVAEAELMRMVGAALVCPLPPLFHRQDPTSLAA